MIVTTKMGNPLDISTGPVASGVLFCEVSHTRSQQPSKEDCFFFCMQVTLLSPKWKCHLHVYFLLPCSAERISGILSLCMHRVLKIPACDQSCLIGQHIISTSLLWPWRCKISSNRCTETEHISAWRLRFTLLIMHFWKVWICYYLLTVSHDKFWDQINVPVPGTPHTVWKAPVYNLQTGL